MKRVVLLHPPDLNTLPQFAKQPSMVRGFPLGLGYLARALQDKYEVLIVDALHENLTPQQTANYVIKLKPDYLLCTTYTVNIQSTIETLDLIHKTSPEMYIIVGGPHATHDYNSLIVSCRSIDYVVLYEAERTLPLLLSWLDDVRNIKPYNVLHNHKGKASSSTYLDQYTKPDINLCDIPSRWLTNFNSYISQNGILPYAVEVISSRGCSHSCAFCASASAWRPRRIDDVMSEVYELSLNYSRMQSILFFDDNFSCNKERVLDFCKTMRRWNLSRFKWSCLCRLDQVDEEMLAYMKEAGCVKIQYGLESANLDILKALGKRLNLDIARRTLAATKRVGIDSLVYLIAGNPGETEDTMKETYEYVKSVDCTSISWSIMQVLPGTRLADKYGPANFNTYTYIPELANPSPYIPVTIPTIGDREEIKRLHSKYLRKLTVYKALRNPGYALKKFLATPQTTMNIVRNLAKI